MREAKNGTENCVSRFLLAEKNIFSCVSRDLISVQCTDAFDARQDSRYFSLFLFLTRLACRYIIGFTFVPEYIDVMDFDGSSKLCLVVSPVFAFAMVYLSWLSPVENWIRLSIATF